MELKRILARDTRSATDKAISLYGPDVLVISNHQVGNQTELVVALDVPPAPDGLAAPPQASPSPVRTEEAREAFRHTFKQAQQEASAPAPAAKAAAKAAATSGAHASVPAQPAAVLLHAPASPAAPARSKEDEQELQRSREIVQLVRDEIAALRREFRLSQQAAAWQGGLQLHPSLNGLVEALNEHNVPTALRTLLVDALQGVTAPGEAIATWRAQLEHHLARPQGTLPTQGVHVLAGPSGSGKTLMCARLARHACGLHGAENLALISYRDQRAGAWSQTQMLGAQLGVDCFRANDEESLRLLLSELTPRALVLIDTPGVQMNERLAEIKALAPQAACHAVLPADASSVTLRKVLVDAQVVWHSVMLSKLDEAGSPWPLLQLISNNDLTISNASAGNRMTDLIQTFSTAQLVDLALAPLALGISDAPLANAGAKGRKANPPKVSATALHSA